MAVKVIKNHPAYHHQARYELAILQLLNTRDADDACHIVRLRDSFVHARHLCLVFEALQLNLYELLKQNNFRGLSTPLIRLFLTQLLTALGALRRAGIIHCDLKPENVLLVSLASGALKLIDFGSACAEGRTVYSYIQSRFYRAPEVVLGAPYGASIDMWSLGCVAAELFLGLPLFPGASEYNLMQRITEAMGPPPDSLLAFAKNAGRFFKREPGGWALLSVAEHEALTGKAPALGKRYFAATTLPELIHGAPFRRGMAEADVVRERAARAALLDWMQGVMALDPAARWTPAQAAAHPFITGAPWDGPWRPAAESPRPPLAPPSPSASSAHSSSPFMFGSSPLPSPRSAPMWPGGALPVGLPHSPQTPRGVAIPKPPGALGGPGAASSFSGSAGAPGDYFATAALGLSSPGQYQAVLMQHAAQQQRVAAAAAAARFGMSPLGSGAVPAMPFGFSPPQSMALPFAPAMQFSAPAGGWPHSAGFDAGIAAAAAAGRAAAAAAGAGLPPARRGSSGSRDLLAAAAAYHASAGAGASPRTSRGGPPRAVRRRASEGGASLGGAASDAMDVDLPRGRDSASSPVPNPADWDPSYSDDALLAGDGDGGSAAAQAQAQQAQQVAAMAHAHAQAHVLQIAQAHAWQLQQQYRAWPGLAAQPQQQAGSYGGAAAAGPGLAAWGAQHGAFGTTPPGSGVPPLARRESWSAGGTRPPG